MSAVTFLGLAKKAGKIESGDESVAIAARAGKAKLILTASDAGRSTVARAASSGETAGCPVVATAYTKGELGGALGRDTVGVAAVTDIGFASAFIHKLSNEMPGLEEAKAALDDLNARAEQRKRETRRHERKLRRGGKKN